MSHSRLHSRWCAITCLIDWTSLVQASSQKEESSSWAAQKCGKVRCTQHFDLKIPCLSICELKIIFNEKSKVDIISDKYHIVKKSGSQLKKKISGDNLSRCNSTSIYISSGKFRIKVTILEKYLRKSIKASYQLILYNFTFLPSWYTLLSFLLPIWCHLEHIT